MLFLSQESAKGKLRKRLNPAAAQMGAKAGEKAVEMGAKVAEKQMEINEKQRGKTDQFLGEEVRQNGNSKVMICPDLNRGDMKAIVMRSFIGMLLKLVTGNGEPGTGVWERVYSGNPRKHST